MQRIKTEDGLIHKFPDDASQEEISLALGNYYATNPMQSADNSDSLLASSAKYLNQGINSAAKFALNAPLAAVKDLPNAARDILQGLLTTLANGGQTIATAPSKLLGGHPDEIDFEEFFSPIGSGRKDWTADLIRGVGKYAPAGALGGSNLIGQSLAAAATGFSNAKEGQENLFGFLPSGKTGAAIEDLVGTAGVGGLLKLLEKARPSKIFRGNLSKEELLENVKTTEGTDTSLGKVIGSDAMHRQLANILSKVPFSGANNKLKSAVEQVGNKGQAAVSDILGGTDIEQLSKTINEEGVDALQSILSSRDIYAADESNQIAAKELFDNMKGDILHENVEKRISEILTDAAKEQEQLSRNNYANVSKKAAEDKNFEMRAPEFAKIAQKEDVKKFLNGEESLMETYENLINLENAPIEYDVGGRAKATRHKVTINEANILKAKLNRLGNDAARSSDMGDRYLAGKFKKLATSIGDGIEESIKKSGNEELAAEFSMSQKNYGENYAPHLDTDVYKYQDRIGSKTDIQGIAADIVKTGKSDKSNRVRKISKKLGKESGLLSYSYFKSAINDDGSVNLKKVGSLVSALGNEQFKELMPSLSDREKLLRLVGKQEAFSFFSPAMRADSTVDAKTLSNLTKRLTESKEKLQKIAPESTQRAKLKEFMKNNAALEAFKPVLENDGKINSAKLATAIGKLLKEPGKFREIVPKKGQRERLLDFKALQGMNENSASSLANTPNGQKLMDLIPYILIHGGGIAGFGAPGFALRPFVNKLTSPAYRNQFVKDMLSDEKKFDTITKQKAYQLALQAVMNAMQRNAQGDQQ